MKTIFYFVFFVFLSGCAMMEKSEPSERELTTIREIDKFSKTEIQNSITEWFATTYKDSRNVIKLNDRNAGTIVGTGSLSYVVGLGVTNARYNIKIDIKDGRYRTNWNGFVYAPPSSASGKPVVLKQQVESIVIQVTDLEMRLYKFLSEKKSGTDDW
ncbi:uncharacterized protein with TBP-like fold DUF4468 [Marinobacter sp. LV10R520-4]|uniref:DUF4468 domain-containing protein n=1 Tax=Marinobacter sp. LV10R520-4 TaxID=1761796 RepID=UPI000BF7AAD8|nr:DUF4468 domain-containing protein [Marinobacter sp. LV10R520-4]PFG54627.1 uncharacterized protein with TBP-like fold DUF4468 [Marinobacter sp. LV10R520-4]